MSPYWPFAFFFLELFTLPKKKKKSTVPYFNIGARLPLVSFRAVFSYCKHKRIYIYRMNGVSLVGAPIVATTRVQEMRRYPAAVIFPKNSKWNTWCEQATDSSMKMALAAESLTPTLR